MTVASFRDGSIKVVLAMVVALLAPMARAQVQPVTAYFAVVSADDTPLRSGDGDLLYPVAKLAKGTLLRVDGQGKGYLRVAYPAGTACFVPADSVQIDAGSKTATVTKPTRLKALNVTTGYKGSWKDVLDQTLNAGAKLTLADSEPVPDGRGNAAYKVVPHEQARAFVQEGAVVKATQEQINEYMAKVQPKNGEKPSDAHAAKPEKAKTDKPTTEKPVAEKPADDGTNLAQPKVTPKPEDGQPQATNPVDQPKVTPVEPPKNPYERLETAFDSVRKQPVESAEYTPLLGEYQTAIDGLQETPLNVSVKRRLTQRRDYLKLQIDIQAKQRELAEAKQNLSLDEQKLADRMKDVERTRQYTIVGRLSASTIYDGKRLPLMFRVMAIGGQSSRTLAYLKPDEKLKIEGKIGQVVGILGESRLDPTLKSNVITPIRIDTLEATPTMPVAPTEPPSSSPPVDPSATKPSADAPGNSGGR